MNQNHKSKDEFIFGIHPLEEALEKGKEIDKVLMQHGLHSPQISAIKKQLEALGIPLQAVPKEKLNALTRKAHQGLIAFLSPVEFQPLEEVLQRVFEQGRDPFLMVLDRVTDVRNFGAICRSAECAGADAIIIPARGSARIGGDAVKTSAGALMHLPVIRSMNLKDTLEYLKNSGIRIAGASEKAKNVLYDTDLSGPICILMGSEETGISPEYLKKCDELVKIPMLGQTESLNVSVAAGLVLYEVVRQRSA
ncbi:MAG: 23S rRNA (guanosine(2251)-2'-O)-methyltransferase RlmB [Bacteroidia bacterium]|jgi:23S rRNA (guanosine2251-2'-O)-methyltransferase